MAVTASARSWNDRNTFEQVQRRCTRTMFSVVFFSSGSLCPCALHVNYRLVFFLLSGFCSLWVVAFPTSDGPTPFIRVYRIEHRRLLRAQYVESSIGIAFPRASEWCCRHSFLAENDLANIALSCHFALDSLCYMEEVLVSER